MSINRNLDSLNNISQLEQGWDCYDAPPVEKNVIENTRKVIELIGNKSRKFPHLNKCSIAPIPYEGINISWNIGEYVISIEVENPGSLYYHFCYIDTNYRATSHFDEISSFNARVINGWLDEIGRAI